MVASSSGSMATSGSVATSGEAVDQLAEGDDRHRGAVPTAVGRRPSEPAGRPPGSGSSQQTIMARRSGHLAQVGEDPVPALLVDEDHRGPRVAEAVGQLGAGPPGVEGDDDRARRRWRPRRP